MRWFKTSERTPPSDRPVLIAITLSHHHDPEDERVVKATWDGDLFRISDEYYERCNEELTGIDPVLCLWAYLPRPSDGGPLGEEQTYNHGVCNGLRLAVSIMGNTYQANHDVRFYYAVATSAIHKRIALYAKKEIEKEDTLC